MKILDKFYIIVFVEISGIFDAEIEIYAKNYLSFEANNITAVQGTDVL